MNQFQPYTTRPSGILSMRSFYLISTVKDGKDCYLLISFNKVVNLSLNFTIVISKIFRKMLLVKKKNNSKNINKELIFCHGSCVSNKDIHNYTCVVFNSYEKHEVYQQSARSKRTININSYPPNFTYPNGLSVKDHDGIIDPIESDLFDYLINY